MRDADDDVSDVYEPSRLKPKRVRATNAQMAERAKFLIDYAAEHGPITVRGLYYQAEVAGLPTIGKDESGYFRVQKQVLALRRSGDLAYSDIADSTRWMRKPTSYDSIEDALAETARTYRRNLWRDTKDYVEVWIEKDALAGVVFPVTAQYDVPLMVTRGFSSETFAYEAIAAQEGDRDYYVYYLGDFDRAGRDGARSLEEKLQRFAAGCDFKVVFKVLALSSPEQVRRFNLSTREPKRVSVVDQKWPHDFACELDAFAPDTLRSLVRKAIERHLPKHQLDVLKVAEESEREMLKAFIKKPRRRK